MSSEAFDLVVWNVSIASTSTGWRPRTGWLACRGGKIAVEVGGEAIGLGHREDLGFRVLGEPSRRVAG